MLRVCLLGPPTMGDNGATLPPLTLVHLATWLHYHRQELGLELRVVDLQLAFARKELRLKDENLHLSIIKEVSPENSDVLLVPTMCNNLPLVVNVCRACKRRNPSLRVVVGGIHATITAEALIERFPEIDAVVRGEGEETVLYLLRALRDGCDLVTVDGLVGRRGGRAFRTPDRPLLEDLDSLPSPAFDLIAPLSAYQPDRSFGAYETFVDVGRGCRHGCTFCAARLVWAGQSRRKSPARIYQMMCELADRFGVGTFLFNQDEFAADIGWARSFSQYMADHPRRFDWRAFTRLSFLNEEMVDRFIDAGCRGVFIGVESASRRRLVELRKPLPLERLRSVVRRLTSYGAECMISLIVGFPDETLAELNATLELGLELAAARAVVNLQLLTPHPGTPLWERYRGRAILDRGLVRLLDNGEFLTNAELALVEANPDIFTVFYIYVPQNIPLERLFLLYHDYRRILRQCPSSVHQAIVESHRDPVAFHEDWTRFRQRGRPARRLGPTTNDDVAASLAAFMEA